MEADLMVHRKEAQKKYNFDFDLEEPVVPEEQDENSIMGEVFKWEPCVLFRNL